MNWMFYLKTTETCNLNCRHCFTNGINGPKIYWDKDKVKNWIDRFIQTTNKDDTIHCEFHGGEPFLVDVEEMKEKLKVWEAQHQFKATMDTLTLGKDMRQAKDMMMEFVDQIITRQNKESINANHDSFVIETAARRVLKELLVEFQGTADDIRTKMTANT